MTKQAFLSALRDGLSGLPQADLEERINFYSEMIDDRMEEGVPEEEAVAGLGSVDDVVSQILSDIPTNRLTTVSEIHFSSLFFSPFVTNR